MKRQDAISDDATKFSVEPSDFPRSRPVIVQIAIAETAFSSQDFDLLVNQLKDFVFDSGGWIRHHADSYKEIVVKDPALAHPERAFFTLACGNYG